ncbi:Na,H/K antiporter P-type ATPase alpha subunit family protein (macronuclear) [Tetrahymena thermophila SB210]|uniref:Na,H/K antiporter P-type ATPase alpha subunit family protein n=1 Tax=Tetrahymena thermophila (strain SB210) TaxID=312017 RepID=I7M7R6_TETTS|nr:Na,H/K antiporter P-type ATPase alpha subunit family protein [Tetrahymena thermophila SB210]EAR95708.2 Na,H/K antiporter P-type ATPase alpha subunit family protein [Tetrahymena thermophila SB210]|eukprot:XP_001015953.2 Na,H/K antiporter P-type ATPase alpha subunit family protein [Tetrahymena thermophila SB210]
MYQSIFKYLFLDEILYLWHLNSFKLLQIIKQQQTEYIRGLNQSFLALRLFWILSFGLSLIRFFKYQMGVFDVIINITRLISTFILFIYGVFKPYDQPYIEIDCQKESFIHKFFKGLEKNEFIAYVMKYKIINHQTWKDVNQPFIDDAIELKQLNQGFVQMVKVSDENEQTAEDFEHNEYIQLQTHILQQNHFRFMQEGQNYANKRQGGDMNASRGDSQRQSQIIRVFEELRQSITNVNQVRDQRRSSTAQKHFMNDSNDPDGHNNHKRHHPDIELEMVTDNLHTEQPAVQPRNVEAPKNDKERRQMEIMKRDEHKVDLDSLVKRYGTDLKLGHTQQRAEQLNVELGDNKLTEKGKTSPIIVFLKELSNPFAIMLWVASIFCFITFYYSPEDPSNLYLAIVLIIVIFITAIITFMQNRKSEALMDSFKNFLPQKCIVVREGTERSIHAEKLVLGDIVKIKAGEKIPADIRMIQVNEMKVDNSALTGESEPQLRTTICSHPESLLETSNVAFFGTLCKEGQGIGIVIQIGDKTTLGEIADMASTEKKTKTPLRIEMDRLVIVMVGIALFLGVLFFLLSYLYIGYDILTCVIFGIGILVANVPEGLLGCITVSLAITAQALHKKNVLVKNLESVETLGSTSCICSDKTGTLTQNVMTVEHMWLSGNQIKARNKSLVQNKSELEYDENETAFKELHLSAILSSEAKFDVSQLKDQTEAVNYMKCPVNGDATETGLVRFFQYIEDIDKTRQKFKIPENREKVMARMPFNSTEKYALTIVELPTKDSDYCVYIKGAPEKIWKFCTKVQNGSQESKKSPDWEKKFASVNKTFGKNGERVLGFAKCHLPRDQYPLNKFDFIVSNPKNFNFTLEGYTFTGLISLIDPPKTRVPFAILECRSAGIKVIMVTGDQPPTAASIAKQVNIIPAYVETTDDIMDRLNCTWEEAVEQCEAIVIHGDKIVQSIEQEEANGIEKFTSLRKWVKKPYCVFARTTPAQKLQIVQACQKEGFTCAVTGDGVNDSPAIKQGDIGISMNLTGSDVTKDAADMILLDDDFASIVSGVEEGRKIFDNLKKTFVYLLCSNVPEILPFLAFIIFGIPLPLTNIYMLCICVGTDIFPAIALAFEEAEIDIMTRRPRSKADHMVSTKLMVHSYGLMGIHSMACGFLAYFISLNYYGFEVLELFGMSLYDAYYPPIQEFGTISEAHPYYAKYGHFGRSFNSNVMLGNAKCQDDITQMKAIKDQSWTIDWFQVDQGKYDLRKAFVKCGSDGNWYSLVGSWSDCNIHSDHNYSDFVGNTACYTTDALKYAQSSFFVCIVIFQWSNIFACKSRKSSFATSAVNYKIFQGIIFETCLAILLVLCPGVNTVFGGRPLDFFQFGCSGIPFSIMILCWEEIRKYLLRQNRWFLKYSYW